MASFAENLIYIRQHYGVTQEVLAEQLGVSRQTISKWEAGINFPETEKLLMLCNLYQTNLDDLMRGSVRITNARDTELYDTHMNRFSRCIVAGIALILTSISVLMVLRGVGFAENLSAAVMLALMLIGTLILVVSGLTHSEFKRKNPNIDPSYPSEILDRFGQRFIVLLVSGIGIIMLGIILLVALSPGTDVAATSSNLSLSDSLVVAVFIVFVALGVGSIVYAGMQKNKYDKSEFTYIVSGEANSDKPGFAGKETISSDELKRSHVSDAFCGAIMILSTIIFFVLGFSKGGFPFAGTIQESGFMYSWIAFPVGGMLCGIVTLFMDAFRKSGHELIAEAKRENPWIKVNKDEE